MELLKSEILCRSRNFYQLRFFIKCAAAILVRFLFYYGFAFNVVQFVYHIATAFELTACVGSNWTARSQTSVFLEYQDEKRGGVWHLEDGGVFV